MSQSSEEVVTRIAHAIEQKRAIPFCDPTPDNQYPQVKWRIFGLIETNEIAVLAECGDLKLAACEESGLLFPPMADRIFGIDVMDQELALQLSDRLWSEYSEQLIAKANQQA